MNTTRLNVTLPTTLNNDMNIASSLDMYFDYLDIRVAEKRVTDNEPTVAMDDFFNELELDVEN